MKFRLAMVLFLLAPAVLAAGERNPSTYRIPLPPKPDFSALAWIVGNWSGKTVKHSRQGEVQLSITYGLDQRVLIFREDVSLAATGEAPAVKESSLGVLSADPSGDSYLLQVYSSTGFITRYRVSVAGQEIDFSPVGGLQPPPGWLSRRILERSDVDGFTETVQLAPPQKAFFDYYTVALTRVSPPSKPKPASTVKDENK